MMRNILIFGFIALVFGSCNKSALQSRTEPAVEFPADFEIVYKANEFLDQWHKAAADADFDAFFNALADNSIYIGTDKTEVWSKQEFKDYSKPYFDRGIAWDFKSVERNTYIGENKEYFWFDEILSTWMGTNRGSGIMHYDKEKDEFKVVHFVLSMPIPNNVMNDVIKIIKTYETQEKKK